MTIVHLTASRFFGGPERQMLELAKAMPAEFRSVFVSFSETGLCEAFLEQVRQDGFEAVALRRDTPRLAAAASELAGVLRRTDAEALCCHGYKSNLVGLIAARRLRIPIISVSHGWTGESRRVRLYEALDRRVLRRMDKVVCVSEGQAQKVLRAGVPADKVTAIHDAVRPERFADPDPAYRERLEAMFPKPPSAIIGAAGRLSPEKGFSVLVDAAAEVLKRMPTAGFVLFGDGTLRESLSRQIAAHKLEGKFILAGFHSDIDRFFPHLDLFVQSSYTEGLPNVVLESYAAGVPVVATDVGGTREIIEDGVNGFLVPSGNPAALAGGITEGLADPGKRRSMAEIGGRRVRERFSFSKQARSYIQLLEDLGTVASATKKASPPVRVCFVIDALGVAGTEKQLLGLIRNLDRNVVRPFLCLLDGNDDASRGLLPDDCPTIRLGIRALRRLSTLRAAWRFAQFLRKHRIDVVQTHFPDSTYFAVPVARLAGVKRIVRTRRDLGYWVRPVDRWLGRLYNFLTSAVLVNCEACRQAVIAQEKVRPDRVVVIHNGIDLDRFKQIPGYAPSRNGRPRRVGMLANLRPVKGADVFVRAAAIVGQSHPEVRFQIAGAGDEESVRRVAAECGIEGRFDFLGRVEDVPGFLAGLDVAVLTSHSEGLSNALLEYMAAGRPIVATAVGGNLEVIRHDDVGLLAPLNEPQAIADAIGRLLVDGVLAAELSSAARSAARQRYSFDTMVDRYEELCVRLLHDPRLRTGAGGFKE